MDLLASFNYQNQYTHSSCVLGFNPYFCPVTQETSWGMALNGVHIAIWGRCLCNIYYSTSCLTSARKVLTISTSTECPVKTGCCKVNIPRASFKKSFPEFSRSQIFFSPEFSSLYNVLPWLNIQMSLQLCDSWQLGLQSSTQLHPSFCCRWCGFLDKLQISSSYLTIIRT